MDEVIATPGDGINTVDTPSHKLENIKPYNYTNDEWASGSIQVDDGLHEFPVYNAIPEEHITNPNVSTVIGFCQVSFSGRNPSRNTISGGPHSTSIAPPRLEHTFNTLHPGESKTSELAVVKPRESDDESDDSSQEEEDDETSSVDMDSVPEEDDSTPEENNSTPDEDDSDYDPYYDPRDEPIVQYLYFRPLNEDENGTSEGAQIDQAEDQGGDQDEDQGNHSNHQGDHQGNDHGNHQYDHYQGKHDHDGYQSFHDHQCDPDQGPSSDKIYIVEQEQDKLFESRHPENEQRQNKDLLQIVEILGEMADIHDEAVIRTGKGEIAHRMTLEAIREEADKIHEEFRRKQMEEELQIHMNCESLQESPVLFEHKDLQEQQDKLHGQDLHTQGLHGQDLQGQGQQPSQQDPLDPQPQLQGMQIQKVQLREVQLQKMQLQDHQDYERMHHSLL